MDIAAWLRGLGLEQYETAFRDNEIDWAVLPRLTSEDLREIGVVPIGHRRKLLEAITVLHSPLPNPPPPAGEGRVGVGSEPAAVTPTAERRQLTVMFCDLVGSTALSARLDPEDYREVITAYHRAVADVVSGLDGFVAKYMGDGVLVYFGYPQAHEDDAERAVRAGLAVIDAVGRLDVKSVELQARVGIATGLVVVGDLIGQRLGAGAIGGRRDPEPRGSPASPGRAERGRHRCRHAPSARRSLRIPRSWRRRGQGHRCPGPCLAGARSEHCGEPLRGVARLGAEPADWP